MSDVKIPTLDSLREPLARLRGDRAIGPAATVAIPVNAAADLETVRIVIGDVCRYAGPQTFEVLLVINNYPPDEPPEAIGQYRAAGITVVAVPSVWRRGEAVCLTARVPAVREAASDRIVLFDADCRVPDPTSLLDWYVAQFDRGAGVAYSRVDYYDFRPLWSVRARIAAHYLARWVKRQLLRLPTTRGSNYGVRRHAFLELYEQGKLTDDLNVGPAAKEAGHRVAYSRSRDHAVLTSGRKFRGGWIRLARYLVYRLRYNRKALSLRGTTARDQRDTLHSKPLR